MNQGTKKAVPGERKDRENTGWLEKKRTKKRKTKKVTKKKGEKTAAQHERHLKLNILSACSLFLSFGFGYLTWGLASAETRRVSGRRHGGPRMISKGLVRGKKKEREANLI